MKKEEFFYFPRAEIGYIGNYIQTVVPFVIDESLDLYNLLRKLINYCNELGERNNELQLQMQKLVEFLNRKLEEQRQYIENFLTALYKEWTDFRTELNERYDAFVKEVERRFQEYREWILQEYQRELEEIRVKNNELYTELKDYVDTKVPELIEYVRAIEPRLLKQLTERQKAIEIVIQGYADRFNEFENTITEKLERYNNELNDLITEKVTDLEQKITEWQLYFQGEIDELNNRIDREKSDILSQADSKYEEKVRELENYFDNLKFEITDYLIKPYVESTFNTLIDNGIIDDYLQKAYGSIQTIYSLNGDTRNKISSDVPLYDYNTETHELTDLTTGTVILANKNSIYNYHGRLFVCTGTETVFEYDSEAPNFNMEYSTGMKYYKTDDNIITIVDKEDNILHENVESPMDSLNLFFWNQFDNYNDQTKKFPDFKVQNIDKTKELTFTPNEEDFKNDYTEYNQWTAVPLENAEYLLLYFHANMSRDMFEEFGKPFFPTDMDSQQYVAYYYHIKIDFEAEEITLIDKDFMYYQVENPYIFMNCLGDPYNKPGVVYNFNEYSKNYYLTSGDSLNIGAIISNSSGHFMFNDVRSIPNYANYALTFPDYNRDYDVYAHIGNGEFEVYSGYPINFKNYLNRTVGTYLYKNKYFLYMTEKQYFKHVDGMMYDQYDGVRCICGYVNVDTNERKEFVYIDSHNNIDLFNLGKPSVIEGLYFPIPDMPNKIAYTEERDRPYSWKYYNFYQRSYLQEIPYQPKEGA